MKSEIIKFSLFWFLSFMGVDMKMKPTSTMGRVGLILLQGGAARAPGRKSMVGRNVEGWGVEGRLGSPGFKQHL